MKIEKYSFLLRKIPGTETRLTTVSSNYETRWAMIDKNMNDKKKIIWYAV